MAKELAAKRNHVASGLPPTVGRDLAVDDRSSALNMRPRTLVATPMERGTIAEAEVE